jgi:hypothetical protein
MNAIRVKALMVAGVLASFMFSILVLIFSIPLFAIVLSGISVAWVQYMVRPLALIAAGSTLILGIRACWQHAHRRSDEEKLARTKLETVLYFAVAGAISGVGLMLGGTFVLMCLHMGLGWIDFRYTFPAAGIGLLLGGVVGLLFASIDRVKR